ncbi:unnamed protein product [Alopecurus aequalis]
MCGSKEESLYHSLIICDHARCFWKAVESFFSIRAPKLHPSTWAEDMLSPEVIPRKDAGIMIIVMWAVWHSRNRFTHGEEKFQPQRSMELIDDIVRSLELPPSPKLTKQRAVTGWEPPEEGWLKINIDAAVEAILGKGGTGMVARNCTGEFVFAKSIPYEGVTDPETLQVLACRDALAAAVDKGMSRLVIETDCSNVKAMWESTGGDRSACSHVVCEMRALANQLQGFKLLYVSRASNFAAHCTAKEALGLHSVINYDSTPGFLVAILQSEKLQPVE